jgi:hypothetical protein
MKHSDFFGNPVEISDKQICERKFSIYQRMHNVTSMKLAWICTVFPEISEISIDKCSSVKS